MRFLYLINVRDSEIGLGIILCSLGFGLYCLLLDFVCIDF